MTSDRSPLAELPLHLLDHIMSLLAAEPGGSSVRATCRALRACFDSRNTRLVVQVARYASLLTRLRHLVLFWEPRQAQRKQLLHLVRCCPLLSSLSLGPDLPGLGYSEVLAAGGPQLLQRLQHLSLTEQRDASSSLAAVDLAPLAAATALQHLHLSTCIVCSLAPLARCAGLTRLDFTFKHVHVLSLSDVLVMDYDCDLSPLASCVALEHLELTNNVHVLNLLFLPCAGALQHLNLHGCWLLEDLGPLARCTALQHLDLAYCSKVRDVRPLAACVRLQRLDLAHCEHVSDVSPLASCVALQHLDLSCTKVKHTGLLSLKHLSVCIRLFCDEHSYNNTAH